MANEFNIKNGFITSGNSFVYAGLNVTGGLTSTTISATTYSNLPSATFTGGTVSGATNFISGLTANTFSATTSTIRKITGGSGNTNSATYSFIGGGQLNCAGGGYNAISGGYKNNASAPYSTIGGGNFNSAIVSASFIGGGCKNTTTPGGNGLSVGDVIVGGLCNSTLSAYYGNGLSFIGGGSCNSICGDYIAIVGGYCNIANLAFSFIGGGSCNISSGDTSTISGGYKNIASGLKSFVGGGRGNTASNNYSTIVGGYFQIASGDTSFIGGGLSNITGGLVSTVVAGRSNSALGSYSFIGGGYCNTASNSFSTVGGGCLNVVGGACSFIGGGVCNIISGGTGDYSTISGGYKNTVGCNYSFIGSGRSNRITTQYSGILGGSGNTVSGAYSFAAGCGLNAVSARTFYANNIIVSGTSTSQSTSTAFDFYSSQSSGDEGGELRLNKPATNSTISGVTTIDMFQNKLRFFESGGSSRGAFIDLTRTSSGVGTNLIVPRISSGVDSSGNTTTGAFTIVSSVVVSANTFTTGDTVSFKMRIRKSATNGTVNYRINSNTTLNLTGSQTVGVFNAGATIVFGELERTLIVKGATSEVFNTSITNAQSDVTTSTSSVSSLSIDWTVDQYIMFNVNQSSASDTTNISYYSIRKI
jgi:hypothetical protein